MEEIIKQLEAEAEQAEQTARRTSGISHFESVISPDEWATADHNNSYAQGLCRAIHLLRES